MSTDGGTTWARDTLGTTNAYTYFLALDPASAGRVFVGGSENGQPAIYETQDSGTTWTKLTGTGLAGTVYAVAVKPGAPTTIFAGTSSGIYRSTDGGSNFTKVNSTISNVKTLEVLAASPNTIYLGTGSQGAWRSTDGGTTWATFNDGLTPTAVNRLEACGTAYLLAGTSAAIWRTSLGVGVQESEWTPVEVQALSIAPNPAQGQATISFLAAGEGGAVVSVYDMQGRLVAVPFSGEVPAGLSEFVWDASTEPGGVYLVRVEAAGQAMTGRLVLIR